MIVQESCRKANVLNLFREDVPWYFVNVNELRMLDCFEHLSREGYSVARNILVFLQLTFYSALLNFDMDARKVAFSDVLKQSYSS